MQASRIQSHAQASSSSRPQAVARVPASKATAATLPVQAARSGNWAIVKVPGGIERWVEEGQQLALCTRALGKLAKEASIGKIVRFKEVVAFKGQGALQRGKPFVRTAVVEAVLGEEFQAPNEKMLRKVHITKITDSKDEEAEISAEPSTSAAVTEPAMN